jgi:hypothetical protein
MPHMHRRTKDRSAFFKRQALAKRFPIPKDELTRIAQEAAASPGVAGVRGARLTFTRGRSLVGPIHRTGGLLGP